jgi:putative oxidoreductase
MARKSVLFGIRLLVSLNLLYAAILLKFAGAPLSVAAFTGMSNAAHGLISQPVFRIGSGVVETVLALLFLVPKTARYAAALIALWMLAALLSHIFVLGYGWLFADAVAIFVLPCLYLFLTRTQSGGDGSDGATRAKTI